MRFNNPLNPPTSTYTPTIDDLIAFTGGFETFRPDVYELPDSKGNLQPLTGYGFADKESLDLARQGKMTKEYANSLLRQKLQNQMNDWKRLLPEVNNLPIEMLFALTDTSYNGHGVEYTISHSPKMVSAIKSYIPGNRDSLMSIVKEMDHSKSAGGGLGARSAARRAMAQGAYKGDGKEVDKYGRQIDSSRYSGTQDWNRSPYIGRYQQGGIVYKPFISDTPKSLLSNKITRRSLSTYSDDFSGASYPVEPVKVQMPGLEYQAPSYKETIMKRNENPVTEPQIQRDNTRVAQPPAPKKSSAEYKTMDKATFKKTMFDNYYSVLKKRGLDDNMSKAFARRLVVQDALESNWGKSSLSAYNNFGGVKDFRKDTNAAVRDTTEYHNGVKQTIKQPFRKFDTIEEYCKYKVDLLDHKWKIFEDSPENMYTRIVSGKQKYATDPRYASKLNAMYSTVGGE